MVRQPPDIGNGVKQMKQPKLSEQGEQLLFELLDIALIYTEIDEDKTQQELALRTYIAQLESKITRLVEDADEYVEKIQQLESAQQWREIETAPKDGTHILLFVGGECVTAYYQYTWFLVESGEFVCDAGKPTHWMPLPAPPK